MNFVPDMFEYGGPVDLTEYYVRRTEIHTDTDPVFLFLFVFLYRVGPVRPDIGRKSLDILGRCLISFHTDILIFLAGKSRTNNRESCESCKLGDQVRYMRHCQHRF